MSPTYDRCRRRAHRPAPRPPAHTFMMLRTVSTVAPILFGQVHVTGHIIP